MNAAKLRRSGLFIVTPRSPAEPHRGGMVPWSRFPVAPTGPRMKTIGPDVLSPNPLHRTTISEVLNAESNSRF